MEDYNADFLTMLETWDAAINYSTRGRVENVQPIEIATLLGWTMDRTRGGAAVSFWPSRDGQAYQPIDSASPPADFH